MYSMRGLLLIVAGTAGCGLGNHTVGNESAAYTGSCDPARATGAVPPFQRALLDTVATTEGTYQNDADDGYDVAFGYHYFSSCVQHPGVVYCSGSLCSDASGRYQFLSTTWNGLGYPNFYPNYQDQGAMQLISRRGAVVPSDRALTYGEFVNVMDLISWEWASLPPGRYGQPSRTMDEAWSIYSGFASHVSAGGGATLPTLVAARNLDGHLELFFPGVNGALYHDWQPAWSGAVALGGAAKQLAVGQNSDGRLEMFYVGTDNALYHKFQTAPNGGWSGEAALGGSAKQVAVGQNFDGRLEIVYVGTNNALYHNWQAAGGWSGEAALGGSAKQVAMGRNADGRLEIVYVGTNDALYHKWQTAPNGSWSSEAALGGLAQQVIIASNRDGHLEIFYIGTNDALYHQWQTSGGWSGEAALGGLARQIAVASNADGRLELTYVGTNNALYHNWQTSSGWSGETDFGGTAKQLSITSNADGRLEMFYVGTNDQLYHRWQTAPNGVWSGDSTL